MDSTVGKKVRRETKEKPFLPDQIVQNILVWLPAKSVMRCRPVVSKWRDITSTRDFVDSNFKNSISTIFVANPRAHSGLDLFALDKWWKPSVTRLPIHRFPFYSGKYCNKSRALFSHAGLIVLHEDANNLAQEKFVILNPIRPSNECVRISFSKELGTSRIYGVYFHPLSKEYCSLWEICNSGASTDPENRIQFHILTLGPIPDLKAMINPFCDRVMMMEAIPLYINNHIYWKLRCVHEDPWAGHNDILEFDIISEKFMVIPSPVPTDTKCLFYETYLLDINGILSFLLIVSGKITIWRLEDRTTHIWTSNEYPFTLEIDYPWKKVRGISLVDWKLALMFERKLFVCNLMDGSMKSFQKDEYSADVSFLSHQMSLASLCNCKDTIDIYHDGNDDKVVAV